MRIRRDAGLRRDIVGKLERDQVDPFNVRVQVKHGHATITGRTPTHSERLRIRVLASDVVGDGNVTDLMEVGPVGKGWKFNDAQIAAGVAASLLAADAPRGVGFEVDNHVVTLTGSVSDHRSRAKIRHVVQHSPGVHFVDNRIEVAGAEAGAL